MLSDQVAAGPAWALVHGPVIVGEPPLLGDLDVPPGAGALVIIVHQDSADCRSSGQQFIADVLQANRFCTLSIGLRTAEERAEGRQPPGLAEARERIRRVMDWVAAQPALRHRCLALMGVADAVPACMAAARLPMEPFIHSMVLVDGRLEITGPALAHLDVPTLLLAGRTDAMAVARYLALHEQLDGAGNDRHDRAHAGLHARRFDGAPIVRPNGLSCPLHRVELIPNSTRPVAEPGALESIACATTAWFGRTLPPPQLQPSSPPPSHRAPLVRIDGSRAWSN